MTAVLVIGVGHSFRGDDAAGPKVAEMVAALGLRGVTTLPHHGEGTDLMERWQGFARVVVVDATHGGAPVGTVRHWDDPAAVPAAIFPKGSHVFGLAEALALAALLGRLPPALRVVGIEGVDFTAGGPMHPEVTKALELAVGLVVQFA